jgi:DnaK suppressor protein
MNLGDVEVRLTADRDATVQRIASMTADLTALAAASADSNLDDEHDPEGATVAFEREQLAALRSRAEAHLIEVDAALDRLCDNRYGRCEICGQAIGEQRLVALPAARRCLRCASAATT